MAYGDWLEKYCTNCGSSIRYHVDWDRVPDLCKSCLDAVKAKWHETRCQDCGTSIKYHDDWNRIPDLCKSCIEKRKAQWKETSCADCGNRIKYHVDWDRIPDLCKSCRDKRQAKWRETSCSKCGTQIKYNTDWARVPDLCKGCLAKLKENRAKWHDKSCNHCGTSFRYHQDWTNIPDYCRTCNTWITKQCAAQGCYDEIRYKVYWDRIPEYCRACKRGERPITETRNRSDGGWDEYTGWGYVNRNGLIVFVDNGPNGKHSHTVYDADGRRIGKREEGHAQEWESDVWKEAICHQCGGSFFYHVDFSHIPTLCTACRTNEPKMHESHEKGFHGEMTAESVSLQDFRFQATGYEPPLDGQAGIDRIFRDGNDIVVIEAKSVSGYPPSALTHNVDHTKQMDLTWIEHHAATMAASELGPNRELGNELLARLSVEEGKSVRRILINTHPVTGIVTCYETYDKNAASWVEISPWLDQ